MFAVQSRSAVSVAVKRPRRRRPQAVEAAQAASDAISTAALLLSLAALLGLAAAIGAAFAGKPESMIGDRLDDHV
ncbi:hypothetical protein [Roseovarius indicus]|uniref:hypothetical protein n=1 Tax=Roseovarius indicus TaxID=540747 RepID=UPI0040580462